MTASRWSASQEGQRNGSVFWEGQRLSTGVAFLCEKDFVFRTAHDEVESVSLCVRRAHCRLLGDSVCIEGMRAVVILPLGRADEVASLGCCVLSCLGRVFRPIASL